MRQNRPLRQQYDVITLRQLAQFDSSLLLSPVKQGSGPKWRSMSHGRQRFYVTSRRIFAVRAESFERTTAGREAMLARISKAAQQLFAEVVDICAWSLWKRKLGPFSKLAHIV